LIDAQIFEKVGLIDYSILKYIGCGSSTVTFTCAGDCCLSQRLKVSAHRRQDQE